MLDSRRCLFRLLVFGQKSNQTLGIFKDNKITEFITKHQEYLPLAFFFGGFVFDTMTLGRIDRLYDIVVLSSHMTLLTVALYLYNLCDDGKWKGTILERVEPYFPLAIQFFFGALSSAFVIYFFRSVSLSKTIIFFIILVILLIANEFLKKRISNKYLQFSLYFFVSFIFFTFMIPVFIKVMNTYVFMFSGLVALTATLALIRIVYTASPSTRAEINRAKIVGLIIVLYSTINLFYFCNLIPPVPLALEYGIVAHDIVKEDDLYMVSYQQENWPVFWREYESKFTRRPDASVYIFTSIFAPTAIEKSIFHRWMCYNDSNQTWDKVEDLGYEITGGRDEGYRGYTVKNNVKEGSWKVEVITEEELIIGVIKFEIVDDPLQEPKQLIERVF